MKKQSLVALLGLSLATGVFSGGFKALDKAEAAPADYKNFTVKKTNFFVSLAKVDTQYFDVTVSCADFEFTGDGLKENALGVKDQSRLEHYQALNFFNYIEFHTDSGTDTLPGWGSTTSNGIGLQGYTFVNARAPMSSVLFRMKYNSSKIALTDIKSVTLKKGFQVPSYEYVTNNSDTSTNVVYESTCETIATAGSFNWGWKTELLSDVKAIKVAQALQAKEEGTNYYVGFDLENDDWAGDQADTSAHGANYKDQITNGKGNKPFINYGLFSLGTEGAGMYAPGCKDDSAEAVAAYTIPAGTTFPCRSQKAIAALNNDTTPVIHYATTKAKTFNLVDGEYVCAEDLAEYKIAAVTELENYVKPTDYYSDEQTTINGIISTFTTEVQSCTNNTQVDTKLAAAKAAIDDVPTKIDIDTLSTAKADGKTEIQGYKTAALYKALEAASRTAIINKAVTDIDSATSAKGVTAIVNQAKLDIDALKTYNQYGVDEITEYKKDVEYRTSEAQQRTNIIASATTFILAATTKEAVDDLVAAAKDSIDDLKTGLAYEKEEAVEALESYKTSEFANYRSAQQTEIVNLKAEGIATINAQTSVQAVKDKLSEYKGKIDAVKTDAQLTAKELADAKTAAIAEIDTAFAAISETLTDNYTDENISVIVGLVTKAKADVNAATEISAIQPIVDAFKVALANVPKIEPRTEEEGGCGSSISASLGVMSLVSLLGVSILLKKKEK